MQMAYSRVRSIKYLIKGTELARQGGKVVGMQTQNSLAIALAVTVTQRRDELRMTREELADAMGVPLEIVVDIEESRENDCLCSKNTLMLLALALRLSEDALVGYIQPARSPEPKRLILPPMFGPKPKPPTSPASSSDDEDQQTAKFDLEALPSSAPPRRPKRQPVILPDSAKSPFIPHHAVEKTKPIHLSIDKPHSLESLIGDLQKVKPNQQVRDESQIVTCDNLPPAKVGAVASGISIEDKVESGAECVECVECVDCGNIKVGDVTVSASTPSLSKKKYVPQLASRLPFNDIQRETGIIRLEIIPKTSNQVNQNK